tara:strand:+ start:740 stop:1045 length:306 start_codon:yes stop_codon:yes gene_type:complete
MSKSQIIKLEKRVSELENRISYLESLISKDSNKNQVFSNGWENKSNWRKLKRNMSKDNVRKILGEPERITQSSNFTYWTYKKGKVTFYTEKLDSWTEPISW